MNEHELEKASLAVRVLGRFLWNLYQGCIESGFDTSQSFSIILEYTRGIAQKSFDPSGPDSDAIE
jgi:hypothetical protein